MINKNYIRTKDGIYEENYYRYQLGISNDEEQFVGINKPIKQADTIEELCDKFVIYNKNGINIRTSFESVKAYIKCYDKIWQGFVQNVYGAIWTDKGLIYVAKMNEKGELELL